jgi:hypothetical protein
MTQRYFGELAERVGGPRERTGIVDRGYPDYRRAINGSSHESDRHSLEAKLEARIVQQIAVPNDEARILYVVHPGGKR